VEIEVMHKDQGSDLSALSDVKEHRYMVNASDISSMPPDSVLDGPSMASAGRVDRSGSPIAEEVVTTDTLKTPSRRRSRSLSRERIKQKVIEKLGNKPRDVSGSKSKNAAKSRSRSVSKELVAETVQSPKRKSSRHHHSEDIPSGAESSIVSTSQVSDRRRSGDQYSFRSGTTKSSINNPKLLETVEDAIRRLILPELTALRHTQQHTERRDSFASGSSRSREELTRKVSKESNGRGKPKVVLNRDENHSGTVLSGDSIKRKKNRYHENGQDSPSERSFDRGMSEETVIRDEAKTSRKSSREHKLRDMAVGALAGGILTHAALKHHDSKSSLEERRERRKKHGKSHSRTRSRSESLAESAEDTFHKHEVPRMPMRSEITDSDLTRESILSDRTSTPTSERRRTEIREVARGSSREIRSPGPGTPTKAAGNLPRGLATYRGNDARDERSLDTAHGDRNVESQKSYGSAKDAALVGAAAGAGAMAVKHALERHGGHDEHHYVHGRSLSPIQSVTSYQEEVESQVRDSIRRTRSSGSFSSLGRTHDGNANASLHTISSPASIDQLRLRRPQGINLETEKEILGQHEGEYSQDPNMEAWYDQQHEENDRYRNSFGNDDLIEANRLTNFTDDSMDAPYLDKVTAAQQIREVGANPGYVHTPLAVESAVASLLDQSILGGRSTLSGHSGLGERSYLDSPDPHSEMGYEDRRRETRSADRGSPAKHGYNDQREEVKSPAKIPARSPAANSPRQSVARSIEEPIPMTASGVPLADDPLPEIGHGLDSTSDISTNPSIIKGMNRSAGHLRWPSYQPTPPQSKGELPAQSSNNSAHDSLKAAAAKMLAAAAGGAAAGGAAGLLYKNRSIGDVHDQEPSRDLQEQPFADVDDYQPETGHDAGQLQDGYSRHDTRTPLMARDEGYISAAPNRSPVTFAPKREAALFDNDGLGSVDDSIAGDDVFAAVTHLGHKRHASGNSHGMASPLYDGATGRGMDRIQSKDIVALMDHVKLLDRHRQWMLTRT
jgi:hypothetical protein